MEFRKAPHMACSNAYHHNLILDGQQTPYKYGKLCKDKCNCKDGEIVLTFRLSCANIFIITTCKVLEIIRSFANNTQ